MATRPNNLLVTAEDICPNLGCYGDPNALTPNLDRFASEGVMFTNVFSVHPCCFRSSACLATGVYPTRLGTFQHRARMWVSSDEVRCTTSILLVAGKVRERQFAVRPVVAADLELLPPPPSV